MNNFRDLKVWQKAIDLTEAVYASSRKFPDTEKFGLISQMQRAAVSISSNIAEGSGRQTKPDFKHFLSMALGSAYELESQMIISQRLRYLAPDVSEDLISKVQEIQKMTYSLRSKI
jgi:four helix bundle protein